MFRLATVTLGLALTVWTATSAPLPVRAQEPPIEAAGPAPELLYDQAFTALASGDRALAARHLQQLVLDYPDHAVTAKARPLLEALATADMPPAVTRVPPPPPAPVGPQLSGSNEANATDDVSSAWHSAGGDSDREEHTSSARAELIFFQTLHGIALGLEVCTIMECDDAQPWVGAMMFGGGLGFGASYLLSRDGLSPGLARALTNGALWGAAHGIDVFIGAELDVGADEEGRLATSLAVGQLGGMGVGALLYNVLRPTAGQVSLTSSGGLWATVLTAQMLGVLQPNDVGSGLGWLFMATGDLGLVAGAVLGSHQPMSASRVLMIDAGGLLGTLIGLGLGVLAAPQDEFGDAELGVTFGLGIVGTLGGLGSAYYLTHDWDQDGGSAKQEGHAAQFALAPTRDGATLSIQAQW